MSNNRYPPGWDEQRVRRILDHYDQQSEDEAVAEDEDRYDTATRNVLEVPKEPSPKDPS